MRATASFVTASSQTHIDRVQEGMHLTPCHCFSHWLLGMMLRLINRPQNRHVSANCIIVLVARSLLQRLRTPSRRPAWTARATCGWRSSATPSPRCRQRCSRIRFVVPLVASLSGVSPPCNSCQRSVAWLSGVKRVLSLAERDRSAARAMLPAGGSGAGPGAGTGSNAGAGAGPSGGAGPAANAAGAFATCEQQLMRENARP